MGFSIGKLLINAAIQWVINSPARAVRSALLFSDGAVFKIPIIKMKPVVISMQIWAMYVCAYGAMIARTDIVSSSSNICVFDKMPWSVSGIFELSVMYSPHAIYARPQDRYNATGARKILSRCVLCVLCFW